MRFWSFFQSKVPFLFSIFQIVDLNKVPKRYLNALTLNLVGLVNTGLIGFLQPIYVQQCLSRSRNSLNGNLPIEIFLHPSQDDILEIDVFYSMFEHVGKKSFNFVLSFHLVISLLHFPSELLGFQSKFRGKKRNTKNTKLDRKTMKGVFQNFPGSSQFHREFYKRQISFIGFFYARCLNFSNCFFQCLKLAACMQAFCMFCLHVSFDFGSESTFSKKLGTD